jgi:DNA-binding XRE family transcriptional regulator
MDEDLSLAVTTGKHNNHAMATSLTRAVQAAIAAAPCSVNRLAQAAGVPQSTLSRIESGIYEASPPVAAAVAKALRQWSKRCERAAARIIETQGETL